MENTMKVNTEDLAELLSLITKEPQRKEIVALVNKIREDSRKRGVALTDGLGVLGCGTRTPAIREER